MKIVIILISTFLTACNTIAVNIPLASCAKLVPADWSKGVGVEPIPDTPADALGASKAWAGAYVAANARVEKADGRTADAIGIFSNCEAMVNAARPKGLFR